MLARVSTFAIDGVEPRRSASRSTSAPDCRRSRSSVSAMPRCASPASGSAPRSSTPGSSSRRRRITANLAPASLRKAGPGLTPRWRWRCSPPAAVPARGAARRRRVRRAVAGRRAARLARACSPLPRAPGGPVCQRLVVPRERAREAALVDGIEVVGGRRASRGRRRDRRRSGAPPLPAERDRARPRPTPTRTWPTCAATRCRCWRLQIAAAGGHNLLLEGAPGTGKTMLARRLPSILPPLTPRGGDRGHADPQRRRRARRRADREPPVPGAPSHDLAGRAGRAAARRHGRAKPPSRIMGCCS